MSDSVEVTLPSGTKVTVSEEQAKRYKAEEPKPAPRSRTTKK